MIATFDTDQFKTAPFKHQIDGVKHILAHPYAAIFDEMGVGKTKQVLDAGCVLFTHGVVDVLLIVVPASVKINYLDKDPKVGQIAAHVWAPYVSYAFHSKGLLKVHESTPRKPRLNIVVTNYEFIRNEKHARNLLDVIKGHKVMIVADESLLIKHHTSNTFKMMYMLRQHCDRAYIMDGMGMAGTVLDLYAQFAFLNPKIIGSSNWYTFRAHHCIMEKKGNFPVITGYKNIPELQAKIAPYVIRRKKEDCYDLPEKLFEIVAVPLSPPTWSIYCEMRDQMVAWLSDTSLTAAKNAGVRGMRLSQICSGILGGVEEDGYVKEPQVIGTEKVDAFMEWFNGQRQYGADLRFIVWSRFRKEREVLAAKLRAANVPVYEIYGGQKAEDRSVAISEFTSATRGGSAVLIGQPQAGGRGLNLTTAWNVVYLSNDFQLDVRLQSEDRAHRFGMKNQVTYYDFVATGPKGQNTVDLKILKALKHKHDVNSFTTDAWRKLLMEDDQPF